MLRELHIYLLTVVHLQRHVISAVLCCVKSEHLKTWRIPSTKQQPSLIRLDHKLPLTSQVCIDVALYKQPFQASPYKHNSLQVLAFTRVDRNYCNSYVNCEKRLAGRYRHTKARHKKLSDIWGPILPHYKPVFITAKPRQSLLTHPGTNKQI